MRNDMGTPEAPLIDDATFAELDADPYPHFARWRRESPVGYLPMVGGWVVLRHDDCDLVGKAEARTRNFGASTHAFFGPHIIVHMDGEEHRRMRNALDLTMSPRAVRQHIDAVARPASRRVLRELQRRGTSADATTQYLETVSVRVVGDILGLKDVDDATLQRWFHDLMRALGTFDESDPDAAQVAAAARKEAEAFLEARVEELTSHPDESTLSHMIHADTPDGRPRSWEYIRPTALILIMGGFQEPGHAAASSLLGLLENPTQFEAVQRDRSLIPSAIQEGLRWISPFNATARMLREDFDISGVTVPAGSEVQLMIGSANRDESRYDRPDEFDLSRPRHPVASFGYGAHYCAGHFVGRELERIALEEMVDAFPRLRLDPDRPPVTRGFFMRGVRSLPVLWG